MSNRSLINSGSDNSFLGYPVIDTPTDNTALFFVGGEFFFATISESGGIIGVVSLGGGASIFKNITGGIMNLRSLISANGNIVVTQLTDIISFQLSQFLTNLKKISFTTGINIEESGEDLNLNLTDGGAAILKLLNFNTSYGGVSSTALTINNQAKIDIYGPTYLNTINDGIADASKFLALDNTGKIIKSTITDTTTATNTPGTNFKWFMYKTGDTLEFRSFDNGTNINIGIVAGEYVFSVDNELVKIAQINPNLPRSPGATIDDPNNYDLRIGSKNIYFDNFEIGDINKFLVIDPAGTLAKGFAVENLLNAIGPGLGIFKNIVSGFGYFKNLIAGTNINLTSNTDSITVDTQNNLENIYNMNITNTNPSTLQIHNSYVNFPNLIPRTWNPATKKNIWLDSVDYGYGANSLCTGFSCNTVANVGTNTLISADTIATNGNLNLKGLVAGTGITITNTATDITINGAAGTNIFTNDGTSTDDQRVFNGKTPGSPLNKITFNDVNLGLTNNVVYNRQYVGSTETTSFLSFADGGNYSKFVEAPYNYLSQRVDVPVAAPYGSSCVFYESEGNLLTSNLSWMFEVEIYENILGLPQAFVGSYKFNTNSVLTPATYCIKPINCTRLGGAAAQNLINLEAYQTVNGANPVWVLRLVQVGLGLTTSASTYSCFVKDLGKGNKIVGTVLGPSTVTPNTNYLNDNVFLYQSVIGFPPSSLVNYRQFGKDLRINVNGQIVTTSGNTSGTFDIRFNGVSVYLINLRSGIATNNFPLHGCKILKMQSLIASGALVLNTSFTVSFFMTGTGFNLTNQPFEMNIEYV